jgi:enoyl-[acyl-carrier protein] reductase II
MRSVRRPKICRHCWVGKAKRGMFDGDLVEGELEIGQIAGLIDDIKPVSQIVSDMMNEFRQAQADVAQFNL